MKNSHKYSIESETRIKKPEIWNFIKNLNIFGSKMQKFFSEKFQLLKHFKNFLQYRRHCSALKPKQKLKTQGQF